MDRTRYSTHGSLETVTNLFEVPVNEFDFSFGEFSTGGQASNGILGVKNPPETLNTRDVCCQSID